MPLAVAEYGMQFPKAETRKWTGLPMNQPVPIFGESLLVTPVSLPRTRCSTSPQSPGPSLTRRRLPLVKLPRTRVRSLVINRA